MGKAKTPKQSDSSRESERLQISLLRQQLGDAKKPIVLPKLDLPKPLPPPPPPQDSNDVQQASLDARRKAMRRTNAGRGTLFAGETGGYKSGGRATLLG